MGARFSAPVQTGPGDHPASCTMGTASFPGVKRPGRGADHPAPSSAEVEGRVKLYICSPSGPSGPVLGRTFTLYSNTLSLRSYLNVSDQFPHPYKSMQIYSSGCCNSYICIENWKTNDSGPKCSRQTQRSVSSLFLHEPNFIAVITALLNPLKT